MGTSLPLGRRLLTDASGRVSLTISVICTS